MMSHFPHYQKGQASVPAREGHSATPECLRHYGKPDTEQPSLVTELVSNSGRPLSQLTREEYCAVHIAALAQAAVLEHERTKQLVTTHAAQPVVGARPEDEEPHASPQAPPRLASCNTLRHSFATRLLEAGYDLEPSRSCGGTAPSRRR